MSPLERMPGEDATHQLLSGQLGRGPRAEIPRIAEELMGRLKLLFPPGQFIDILPFESGAVPPGVRQAGCQILGSEKKPWWKVW